MTRIQNILQVISIALSFVITYQYAAFLDRSFYDLRKKVNGFSRGLMFISASAVIGTVITAVTGILALSRGVSYPTHLTVVRIAANVLAIVGLHILREEAEKISEQE